MKLFVICKILEQHCIQYVCQNGQVAALMEMSAPFIVISGEWELFDETSTKEQLLIWLGY